MVSLLGCLPLGIAALVFSIKVMARLKDDDEEGAQKASKIAGELGWVSVTILLIGVTWTALDIFLLR